MKRFFLLILGLLIVAFLFLSSEPDKIFQVVSEAEMPLLACALASFFPILFIRALRWHALLGGKVSYPRLFGFLCIGNLANNVLPSKLGALVKTVLVKKEGISGGESIGSVFLDNIIELSFLGFSSAFVAVIIGSDSFLNEGILIGLFLFVLVILAFRFDFLVRLMRKIRRFRDFEGKYIKKGVEDFKRYNKKTLLSKPLVLWAFVLTAASWASFGAVNLMIVNSLGYGIDIWYVFLASTFPVLVGVLTLLPGGLGTQDASMAGIFVMAGLPTEIAVSAALLSRVAWSGWSILSGLVSLSMLNLNLKNEAKGVIRGVSS